MIYRPNCPIVHISNMQILDRTLLHRYHKRFSRSSAPSGAPLRLKRFAAYSYLSAVIGSSPAARRAG
jgi:hypothetical protein